MQTLKIALVGAGMIAKVVANAIHQTKHVQIAAVARRRSEQAAAFAAEVASANGAPRAFADWRELLAAPDIDAVYLATPTAGREEMALAVLDSGRHLLCEKPFFDAASASRLAERAQERGLAFMDATHFTHHPRTQIIRETAAKEIGRIRCVNTTFFFPFTDRTNIRFQPEAEPTGAIGDMAWYSMRAIVEYMQPGDTKFTVNGSFRRDAGTGAVIGGAALLCFADGRSATFDFGYDVGVCIQDASLLGETGMIQLSDFVLDNSGGFAFNNPAHTTGFAVRQGMETRTQERFVAAQSEPSQLVRMLDHFAHLCAGNDPAARAAASARAIHTQRLVDGVAASALGDAAR